MCNEYNGRTSGLASCTGCLTGYHEYTQIIDRTKTDEEVRFYLDGRQTWVVRESQVGVAAWTAAIHHGFFLRFDLAIGGSLPNAVAGFTTPTADTTSGGILSVDSVSVARSTGTTAPAMTDPATPPGPSVVRVTGSQGNWQLQVNGAPYEVRGLTYGPPQGAADGYLRDLKNMGVNTIRTWGVDDAQTPVLLNRAAQQGIKVVVGHWLNQGADYVNDTAYKTAVRNEIVARVNTLKNHQGVLMWDVGNEVILTMQDHGLPAADRRGAPRRVRPVRQRGRRRHPRRRPEPPGHLDRRLDRRLAVLPGARPGPGPARGELVRRDRHGQSRTGSPAATPSRTS